MQALNLLIKSIQNHTWNCTLICKNGSTIVKTWPSCKTPEIWLTCEDCYTTLPYLKGSLCKHLEIVLGLINLNLDWFQVPYKSWNAFLYSAKESRHFISLHLQFFLLIKDLLKWLWELGMLIFQRYTLSCHIGGSFLPNQFFLLYIAY